jgi:hypothetical protein
MAEIIVCFLFALEVLLLIIIGYTILSKKY